MAGGGICGNCTTQCLDSCVQCSSPWWSWQGEDCAQESSLTCEIGSNSHNQQTQVCSQPNPKDDSISYHTTRQKWPCLQIWLQSWVCAVARYSIYCSSSASDQCDSMKGRLQSWPRQGRDLCVARWVCGKVWGWWNYRYIFWGGRSGGWHLWIWFWDGSRKWIHRADEIVPWWSFRPRYWRCSIQLERGSP